MLQRHDGVIDFYSVFKNLVTIMVNDFSRMHFYLEEIPFGKIGNEMQFYRTTCFYAQNLNCASLLPIIRSYLTLENSSNVILKIADVFEYYQPEAW